MMAAGRTPPSIIPHLCGASLLALKKKTGGHQPIAVGEVLRRLVSKCLANQTRDAATSILAPLQLWVGIKGGCEVIVHATSQLRSSPSHNQHWTLMLDFSNAFNSINREAMFVEFRRFLPGLSAWVESCYTQQPLLLLGDNSICSCFGVQQGDPLAALGPLGFTLTLHPLVERIRAEVPSLTLNTWYLDDGTLVGPPGSLATALHIVECWPLNWPPPQPREIPAPCSRELLGVGEPFAIRHPNIQGWFLPTWVSNWSPLIL